MEDKIINKSKQCITCESIKSIDEFCTGRNQCKMCRAAYNAQYHKDHIDEIKQHRWLDYRLQRMPPLQKFTSPMDRREATQK